MKLTLLNYFIKILAFLILALQSLARAFRLFNFSSPRASGFSTFNFLNSSYVIDIGNSLNGNVDVFFKRPKSSKLSDSDKADDLRDLNIIKNLELEALHREFQNFTSKHHLDQILNPKFEMKPIKSRKRSLEISYEDDSSDKKLDGASSKHDLDVEQLIKHMKSESSQMSEHQKAEAESLESTAESPKVNNFRLLEEECKIPNFTKVWNGIANKRNKELAPVDRYGSHCLAEPGKNFEFQTLVACMLSSQTKDEVTASCMDNLKKRGLTLDNILKMDLSELDSLISKVGFHATKAKNIKKTAEILKDKFGGKVPSNKKDLESLPGIGPKMANLIQQIAFNKVDGIAVDLHVHRITNRLGWVKTKTPEETRVKLEELIPKSLWNEINPLLVGFGQTFCTAAGPGCPTCPVNKWCPTGISNLKRHNYS